MPRSAAYGTSDTVRMGLEQSPENVATLDLEVFPAAAERGADNLRYVTYMLNGILWAAGGRRATLGGPKDLCEAVAAGYAQDGPGKFEHEIMSRAFDRPFEVVVVGVEDVPSAKKRPLFLGGHFDGCRIGFDLGASDYKVAAVQNGQVLFSTEIPWNPKAEPNPEYHYHCIDDGFKLAASHLPQVDAIGGSSAGILVDNQVMVASLFRAVPDDMFEAGVRPIFLKLRQEWGVPLEVINDGDITALAGGLSLEETGILGIALGSSEAAGYLDLSGHITGWLNELAFGPVDANPEGGIDDWSGSPGVGAAYFSQQAVNRLAGPAGFTFPDDMPLADRLKIVQTRVEEGDLAARDLRHHRRLPGVHGPLVRRVLRHEARDDSRSRHLGSRRGAYPRSSALHPGNRVPRDRRAHLDLPARRAKPPRRAGRRGPSLPTAVPGGAQWATPTINSSRCGCRDSHPPVLERMTGSEPATVTLAKKESYGKRPGRCL